MNRCNTCNHRRWRVFYQASPGFPYTPIKCIRCPKCRAILEQVGYMIFDTWEEGVAAQVAEHLAK